MTNQTGPTGPRTESGKARSSQNAVKHGLFAARDFILEHERDEYAETLYTLVAELKPEGILEETFTAEIMTATWRLRRCGLLENSLSNPDPDALAAEQKSIDRARAQSHAILRRSLAELRKLQTERAIRDALDHAHLPGLADSNQLIRAISAFDRQNAASSSRTSPQSPSSFCNPPQPPASGTARNALCPCGSGQKYKRCCGTGAPPVLNMAA